jgi:tetratricopeptide (TPR) repeat protein
MIPANAGAVHLMQNDIDAARTAFEEALSMKPDLARAHNSLGVIAAREGRPQAAIEHWKRSLAANPRDPDALFNLGLTLSKAGRHQEARPYLERFLATAPRALYARDLERVRRWLQKGGSVEHATVQ